MATDIFKNLFKYETSQTPENYEEKGNNLPTSVESNFSISLNEVNNESYYIKSINSNIYTIQKMHRMESTYYVRKQQKEERELRAIQQELKLRKEQENQQIKLKKEQEDQQIKLKKEQEDRRIKFEEIQRNPFNSFTK